MLDSDPVRIPEIAGKISCVKSEDGEREYIRYLKSRKYNAAKGYTESEWIIIGRRVGEMPGLMIPNDNYEEYIRDRDPETEEEMGTNEMTTEEEKYIRNRETYAKYVPFFEGLYHEFRQQTRRKEDCRINEFKAESINEVLKPLKDMMQGEDYGRFLRLMEPGEGERGMSYGDGMILLTQYTSALGKFHREHR